MEQTSRLISRLRYRQFGVLVTTSHVAEQAYREIRDDGHPVLVLASGDIVRLLASKGLATAGDVRRWLEAEFPQIGASGTSYARRRHLPGWLVEAVRWSRPLGPGRFVTTIVGTIAAAPARPHH